MRCASAYALVMGCICVSSPATLALAADTETTDDDVAAESAEPAERDLFGEFTLGGAGFTLAETRYGSMNFSAWGYVRYLNQLDLDETYTDSFGRTRTLDLRDDLQLNKVNLYFKGWVYDPKFSYLFFVWTQNASQGEGAQVVVGGALDYRFSERLNVGGGITQNPGTRSLRGTFPIWHRIDARMIADEFSRPSYTTAVYVYGALGEKWQYKATLGNNLSQLGVSASQLDAGVNTFSMSWTWMPSTGEYGPRAGWGDFEFHEEVATLVGFGFTRSREDRQSQPGTTAIENTQIRLSDGTIIFEPDAFLTGGRINRATYRMLSVDAGIKYRGFELSAGYYMRWVDDFETEGFIPVNKLQDWSYQIQASMMVLPKLQLYLGYSKINGQYGDPRDHAVGINWYPFNQRLLRWNTEFLYLKNSPVGYPSVPFALGGNGTVFSTSLEMVF